MREYVVRPVEEEPQERPGPRVYTGKERWATVFEVVYLAQDWYERDERPVPITARKRAWEFTDVAWPSGQAGRVGIEVDTVLGTGEVDTDKIGIHQGMNDLFGEVIVPELDGRWMPVEQLKFGDRVVEWGCSLGPDVMDVTGIGPPDKGIVAMQSMQRGGPFLRWANEWVRIENKEEGK